MGFKNRFDLKKKHRKSSNLTTANRSHFHWLCGFVNSTLQTFKTLQYRENLENKPILLNRVLQTA